MNFYINLFFLLLLFFTVESFTHKALFLFKTALKTGCCCGNCEMVPNPRWAEEIMLCMKHKRKEFGGLAGTKGS